MKKLLIIFLSMLAVETNAQVVKNLLATQSGKKIILNYDLISNAHSAKYKIQLMVSLNGGYTWSAPLVAVSGNVGAGIIAGSSQQIVWDVLRERNSLVGDNIQFKIRAEKINGTINLVGKSGLFTDPRDGNSYKWIKIGNAIWLAENIRYRVPGYSFPTSENATSSIATKNGLFYNYKGAMKACPEGWHVPNNAEWFAMLKELGGVVEAGPKLKAIDEWSGSLTLSNRAATNSSGLNFTPLGSRPSFSGAHMYKYKGRFAYFWSSDDKNMSSANIFYLRNDLDKVFTKTLNKDYGISVRCVKN